MAFWSKAGQAIKDHIEAKKRRLPFWMKGKNIDARLKAASEKAAAATKAVSDQQAKSKAFWTKAKAGENPEAYARIA